MTTLLINKEEYKQLLTENIDYFIKTHEITDILPLNSIKKDNNNKSLWGKALGQYGKCSCKTDKCNNCTTWKNAVVNQDDINQSITNGTTGFIIKTGISNNIFVIDWDFKENQTVESIALRDACIKSNTLTIKTPSGGYHFYFKYDNKISSGILSIYGNIDIRTTGNCCYFGIREDGQYIIDNKESIKRCPHAVLNQIVDKIEERQKKNIREAIYKDIDNSFEVSTEDVENYFITDNNLTNLLNYLLEIDKDFVNDYNKWLSITIICKKINLPQRMVKTEYTNHLNAKKIWNEWSTNSNKYNFKNNNKIWKAIDLKKRDENNKPVYTYNLNYIVKCINNKLEQDFEIEKKQYYKDKKDGLDCVYPFKYQLPRYERIFIPYEKINNLKKPIIINQKYLDDSTISKDNITIIESGLGTGKTRVTNDHITNNNKKALSLVHLISLCENQISNFNKLISEKNIDKSNEMKKYTDNDITLTNSLNSTINSLIKVNDKIKSLSNKSIADHFDIIFIDEAHRIIHSLLTNPCLKDIRRELINLMINIIKNAKQVIMTDGDFDLLTSEFLKLIGRKYKYTKNIYKSFDNIPVHFEDNINAVYLDMYINVKNNKYFTSCCNTAKKANEIYEMLLSWGVPESKIKLYTADNAQKIGDATIEWNDCYIIYSPKIVEGVDRVTIEAEIVYQLIVSETTINIIQLKQQICRNRNIKSVIIYFTGMKNECQYKNHDDFKDGIYTRNRLYNDPVFNNDIDNYNKLVDNRFNNETAEYEQTDNIISKLFITSRWIDYTLRVNMKSSLSCVLSNLGFNIEYDPVINLKKLIDNEQAIRYMESVKYNFAITQYIPETDENGLVEKQVLDTVKTTNINSWINGDCRVIYDTDTDNKLKNSLNSILDDNIEVLDKDFKSSLLSKLSRYDKITSLTYDRFIKWRTQGGVIDNRIFIIDIQPTLFSYSRIKIEYDNNGDNIKNINDRYYMIWGFENLMLNFGNIKYKSLNKIFKIFNDLYNKRDISGYVSKLEYNVSALTNYTKITKQNTADIFNFKYSIIDKIIKTNKIKLLEDENNVDIDNLRKEYHLTYKGLIQKLYTDKTYEERYRCMRYYMIDNEQLLNIINKKNTEDYKIINTQSVEFKIWEFKTLFKKYFPEINLFNLNHTDKSIYYNEKINFVDNDLYDKFIPLIIQSGTRNNLKYETKDDLLKVFRILLENIFGIHFIDKFQKSIKLNGKPVKQNIYSIENKVKDLLRLILLTNKINNIDSDLIQLYNLDNYNTINCICGFIEDDEDE